MTSITIEINSNDEIWQLFDKGLNTIFVHKFNPHEAIEWWQTNLKTKNGIEFKNLFVKQMSMDIMTDLDGLKEIVALNTNQLRIYQFEKPVSNSLDIERLPEASRNAILKQNGLHHTFFIDFEFITIASFEPKFINAIALNPNFAERIIK